MDERLDGLSMDIEKNEREKLNAVFPECFVEGKLDIDKLLTMCGEYMTDDFERYNFTWKGKSECLPIAQMRSLATLRPCKEESVNFDTTQNLYIEGDNLEVLKLIQASYYHKVKMIYIDPPYNTGNDFIYEDDFKDPIAHYKEVTSQTTKSNPETMGRFHTAWLNMMYPRLRLAANLLRDDGVCFISIDDNEVHNLRKICDEVFGEENFIGSIAWESKTKSQNTKDAFNKLQSKVEYILVYTKANLRRFNLISKGKKEYNLCDTKGAYREHVQEFMNAGGIRGRETMIYSIEGISPPPGKQWQIGIDMITEYQQRGDLFVRDSKVFLKMRPGDERDEITEPFWAFLSKDIGTTESAKKEFNELIESKNTFDTVKPLELIKRLVYHSSTYDNDNIILDFFSGSATTAHAVMQLNAEDGRNRRFIMVQLPETCDEKSEAYKAGYKNICEIGKERIRRAGQKILSEKEEKEKQINLEAQEQKTLDIGFKVFKLDTSNLKIWDNTPVKGDLTELERRIRDMLDIIKEDRSQLDIVYEIMLKLSQDLCEEITPIDINDKTVYGIGNYEGEIVFMICLAKHITVEDAKEMAEYAPGRIVFAEECFDDISIMANIDLILQDGKIAMKML